MLMKVAWVKCRVASVLVWPAAVLCPRGLEKEGANMSPGGGGVVGECLACRRANICDGHSIA